MIWQLVRIILQVFLFSLLARIVLSWFPPSGQGALETIRELLFRLTEPVLAPIRNLLPPLRIGGMGLDLSPLVVFLALEIIMSALPR